MDQHQYLDNCKSANSSKHLDIIEMDAASNRGIDDIKDLIEHTKYKPSSARYKIFIIDEVHMLTTQAFNALLKTLEEPPLFVKFILATTDPLKLPATILSRTQHFRFKKIPNKDVVNHLAHILNLENISFENEALEILTRSGQGSLRDTLTLLDQAIIFSKGKITTTAVTHMMGIIDPAFMQEFFDALLDKKNTNDFLSQLESYDAGQVLDEMAIFLKYKMLANDIKFDTFLYDRFFRILGDSKHLLALNSDSQFVLILTILKMQEATKLKTIDETIAQIQNVKTFNQPQIKIQKQESQEQQKEPLKEDLFKKVISLVYDRSYDLGICFENNFSLISYENNTISINSTAQGECREKLIKYFDFAKQCIKDIYGKDIVITFQKTQPKQKAPQQNNELSQTPMVQEAIKMFKVENTTVANS
jgi:DNA polymerase-3 subunit gamma/tau